MDLSTASSICPVCGISRGKVNHAKCSKIMQLRHQQDVREKKLAKIKVKVDD